MCLRKNESEEANEAAPGETLHCVRITHMERPHAEHRLRGVVARPVCI